MTRRLSSLIFLLRNPKFLLSTLIRRYSLHLLRLALLLTHSITQLQRSPVRNIREAALTESRVASNPSATKIQKAACSSKGKDYKRVSSEFKTHKFQSAEPNGQSWRAWLRASKCAVNKESKLEVYSDGSRTERAQHGAARERNNTFASSKKTRKDWKLKRTGQFQKTNNWQANVIQSSATTMISSESWQLPVPIHFMNVRAIPNSPHLFLQLIPRDSIASNRLKPGDEYANRTSHLCFWKRANRLGKTKPFDSRTARSQDQGIIYSIEEQSPVKLRSRSS